MTSLIFSLLIAFATAQSLPLEFVTGFRMRPVRVVATSVTQPLPEHVSELQLITRASKQVEVLDRSIDACARSGDRCDLRIELKDWSELFMLGHLLAGETDHDWMLKPADALAADLATRAVEPFRDNWLYTSSDAGVLNAIEGELARAWNLNQLREFTMHYKMTMKSIADDARPNSPKNAIAPAPLLFDFPPEALRRIKDTPRPCREPLAPTSVSE